MYHADHIGPSESSTVDIENHSKDFALCQRRRSIVWFYFAYKKETENLQLSSKLSI